MENDSLKIAIVAPLLGEAFGQERVLRDSAALLRAFGHKVFFIYENSTGAIPENDGSFRLEDLFNHHTLSPPGLVRRITVRILEYLSHINADVVHVIDQPGFRVLSSLISRYPVVISAHSVVNTCPASSRLIYGSKVCEKPSGWECLEYHNEYNCLAHFRSDGRRAHALQNFLLRRRVLREVDRIIAVSPYIAQNLVMDGWEKEKIKVVYNPLSVPGKPAPLSWAPQNLIVCASRFAQPKGIDFLLKALRRIEHLDWTLWLCGDGPLWKDLEALCAELGLKDRVFFLGGTPYEITQRIFCSSKMLVQPSVGAEAFGLSVAEATSLGVPIVCFNVPALNELVRHDRNGLLADPGSVESLSEKISSVLTDSDLAERLGRQGALMSQGRFSPARHLAETVKVYRESIQAFHYRSPAHSKPKPPRRRLKRKSTEGLRIVMVSPVLGEAFGQERVMRDSGALLRDAGHHIYFIGERRRGAILSNDGVKLVKGLSAFHTLSASSDIQRAQSEIGRFVETVNPHLIHLIDQFDYRLMRTLCERFPVVATSHTMATTCPSSCRLTFSGSGACEKVSGLSCLVHNKTFQCLSEFKSDLHRVHAIQNYLLRRKVLRRAQAVLAISQYVRSTLLRDGWDKEKIRLVYNPVSVPKQIVREPGVPDNLLICASRLVSYKGISVLIRALPAIRDLKWTLWICGEGALRKDLARLTQEVQLSSRIHFKGSLPYETTRRIIASSRALVQPNIGPEPFGLSVAEASAMGVPVVASDVAALNEIITHEKNGLLAKPNDPGALALCLRSILTNQTLWESLRQAGPALITERFSPAAHLKSTLEVYKESMDSFRIQPAWDDKEDQILANAS